MARLTESYATVTKLQDREKRPKLKHTTNLFIDNEWYSCSVKPDAIDSVVAEHGREIGHLDVQILHDRVLRDILGI